MKNLLTSPSSSGTILENSVVQITVSSASILWLTCEPKKFWHSLFYRKNELPMSLLQWALPCHKRGEYLPRCIRKILPRLKSLTVIVGSLESPHSRSGRISHFHDDIRYVEFLKIVKCCVKIENVWGTE